MNIIVLSQPILRSNPCTLYFLSSSVVGLGIILIGLPSCMISEWISIDPTNTISWFCKFRIFILYSCRTTSVWLLVFATIDRWFIRNINRSHQAVRPFVITTTVISQGNRRNRRSEGSLTRMLLLQIILLTLCSIPQAIHQFYLSFTIDVTKNSY